MNYKNNFGALNEDGITLVINDRERTINLKDLLKIQFVKRQKFHINYIAFLFSIYLVLFLINNSLPHFVQLIIASITSILLGVSYFFKTYQYQFILIKKNYLTEIKVCKKLSIEAQNLAYQINKTLTEQFYKK